MPGIVLGPGDTMVSKTLSCPGDTRGQVPESDTEATHRGGGAMTSTALGGPRELTAKAEGSALPSRVKQGIPQKGGCGLRNEALWPSESGDSVLREVFA